MANEKRGFVFELWLHEPGASEPKLVAADFGHPHTFGKAYYVTTRFFDREMKTLQPGFILAFAEAECLRRAGIELWDLGGADHSPMMQYKQQVAVQMNRSEFLRRLRAVAAHHDDLAVAQGETSMAVRRQLAICEPESHPPARGNGIPVGTVFEDIDEDCLFGAAAMRARDKMELDAKLAREAEIKKANKTSKANKDPKEKQAKKSAAKPVKADDSSAPSDNVAFEPQERESADARKSSPSSGAVGADVAKQQFLLLFQRFVAEGLSQTDAAAKALQTVSAGGPS